MKNLNNINELSRPYNLEGVKKTGARLEVKADEQECIKLAERFSIPMVISISADCILKKQAQKQYGDFLLKIEMKAEIIQECVLTLKDVPESINEEFSIIFQILPENNKEKEGALEVEFDLDEKDIEEITGLDIDVGEYIAEYLSLSMSPYPRQDKVSEKETSYKILQEEEVKLGPEKKNPFAVLKDLKHKT